MWVAILIVLALLIYFARNARQSAPAEDGSTIPTIRGNGNFDVEVVGESRYQRHLTAICGAPTADGANTEVYAGLLLEDSNNHDGKAVAVHIENGCVGYLSRQDARSFRIAIAKTPYAKHRAFQVRALIRGGWDRGGTDTGMYGVRLDMPGLDD
jgi:hypothetical protein